MLKRKTSELTGPALDWAVAKCEGLRVESPNGSVYWPVLCSFSPCQSWGTAGVIIERERIQASPVIGYPEQGWTAVKHDRLFEEDGTAWFSTGPNPLIASMRCYVASQLGAEVEIPEELV